MLHLYDCLDLLHFVSLLTIYDVVCNVMACCHAYNYGQRAKVGGPVQMNRFYTLKLFLWFADNTLGS